jgi:tripeptidyl-peptidase-2
LKEKGVQYTPYLIKRAIQNAGLDIQDPMGVKFIQVENAYNYVTSIASLPNYTLHYDISVNDSGRGIYIRGLDETQKLNTFIVNVQPKFVRHDDPEMNLEKVGMEAHLVLKATQGWISVPENVHLNNGGMSGFIGMAWRRLIK